MNSAKFMINNNIESIWTQISTQFNLKLYSAVNHLQSPFGNPVWVCLTGQLEVVGWIWTNCRAGQPHDSEIVVLLNND